MGSCKRHKRFGKRLKRKHHQQPMEYVQPSSPSKSNEHEQGWLPGVTKSERTSRRSIEKKRRSSVKTRRQSARVRKQVSIKKGDGAQIGIVLQSDSTSQQVVV